LSLPAIGRAGFGTKEGQMPVPRRRIGNAVMFNNTHRSFTELQGFMNSALA
jgi:hypothetical protein